MLWTQCAQFLRVQYIVGRRWIDKNVVSVAPGAVGSTKLMFWRLPGAAGSTKIMVWRLRGIVHFGDNPVLMAQQLTG